MGNLNLFNPDYHFEIKEDKKKEVSEKIDK